MRFSWPAQPVGQLDCRRGLARTVAVAIFIAWCFLCFGVVMARADGHPAETGKRGGNDNRGPHLALARETPFHLALPESKACSSGSLKLLPPGDHALRVPPMPLDGPWVFVNLASPPASFDGENLGYIARECLAAENLPMEKTLRQPRIEVVRTLSRGAGKRLLVTADTPEEYQRLREKLFGWFGQTRNGCVAFLSTALRAARVPVPQRAVIEGDPVSLDTRPFVRYLEQDLGWQRITDVSAAQSGDIGVTEDNPQFPGYPGHVFLFAGWKDSRSLVAMVIDNQGFTHPRNLRKDPAWDYGPTQYFLRAPSEADR